MRRTGEVFKSIKSARLPAPQPFTYRLGADAKCPGRGFDAMLGSVTHHLKSNIFGVFTLSHDSVIFMAIEGRAHRFTSRVVLSFRVFPLVMTYSVVPFNFLIIHLRPNVTIPSTLYTRYPPSTISSSGGNHVPSGFHIYTLFDLNSKFLYARLNSYRVEIALYCNVC